MDIKKEVEGWLQATGLPYAFTGGGHHLKIRLDGRMVGIIPTGGKVKGMAKKAVLNTRAQIRRAEREIKAESKGVH